MGFDTNRMKLRDVLKKSGNMKMSGSHTSKVEEKDKGTKYSHSMIQGKGIAEAKKGKQGSYGTKYKYQMIVANQGKVESSSGIAPRKGGGQKSAIGGGDYASSRMSGYSKY